MSKRTRTASVHINRISESTSRSWFSPSPSKLEGTPTDLTRSSKSSSNKSTRSESIGSIWGHYNFFFVRLKKKTKPQILSTTCVIPIMLMIKLIAFRMTRTSVTIRAARALVVLQLRKHCWQLLCRHRGNMPVGSSRVPGVGWGRARMIRGTSSYIAAWPWWPWTRHSPEKW